MPIDRTVGVVRELPLDTFSTILLCEFRLLLAIQEVGEDLVSAGVQTDFWIGAETRFILTPNCGKMTNDESAMTSQ